MFDASKFTTTKAKPLPVYLLLDVSGSMQGPKIDNLNAAVREMLDTFAKEEQMETEILVSVITFGGIAKLHLSPTKASKIKWTDLTADENTPMGAALEMAKDMIEDKNITPSRAYRPTIVLVSDGQPNDSWEKPLKDFINSGRSCKCDRMAMAIGHDADENVLKLFIEGTPHPLFHAENAPQLHESFQRITMSVTARTKSKDPNVVPPDSDVTLDGRTVNVKNTKTGKGKSTGETAGKSQSSSSKDEGYW